MGLWCSRRLRVLFQEKGCIWQDPSLEVSAFVSFQGFQEFQAIHLNNLYSWQPRGSKGNNTSKVVVCVCVCVGVGGGGGGGGGVDSSFPKTLTGEGALIRSVRHRCRRHQMWVQRPEELAKLQHGILGIHKGHQNDILRNTQTGGKNGCLSHPTSQQKENPAPTDTRVSSTPAAQLSSFTKPTVNHQQRDQRGGAYGYA